MCCICNGGIFIDEDGDGDDEGDDEGDKEEEEEDLGCFAGLTWIDQETQDKFGAFDTDGDCRLDYKETSEFLRQFYDFTD